MDDNFARRLPIATRLAVRYLRGGHRPNIEVGVRNAVRSTSPGAVPSDSAELIEENAADDGVGAAGFLHLNQHMASHIPNGPITAVEAGVRLLV